MKLIDGKAHSIVEEFVDVSVGNLVQDRGTCLACGFARELLEDACHFFGGLANPQTNETEGRALVEEDDQNGPPCDQRDVNVGFLAFVKLAGEVFLTQNFGNSACGGDVSSS